MSGGFVFCTSNGGLYRYGVILATGYSGHEQGRNEPTLESHPRLGPIPRGEWLIAGPPVDTAEHGPFVLRLIPKAGTDTFGRGGFLLHGDSVRAPGTASLGCIILPRAMRESIWHSDSRDLLVTSEPPEDDDVTPVDLQLPLKKGTE